jgi:hypothetical protein
LGLVCYTPHSKGKEDVRVNNGLKQTLVGDYFERLAHQLLGGTLSRNEDGDLALPGLDAFVEIKGSGLDSSYGFRLSVPQIERCERIQAFPFERGYYALFAYRNKTKRVGGHKVTELAPHVTQRAVDKYLTGAVCWCAVVDMSVITRWKLGRPRSHKSIMGHPGAVTIDVRCHEVAHLVNSGFTAGLQGLALDPHEYAVLDGRIKVNAAAFELHVLLPNPDIGLVRSYFRRRGHRLVPAVHS